MLLIQTTPAPTIWTPAFIAAVSTAAGSFGLGIKYLLDRKDKNKKADLLATIEKQKELIEKLELDATANKVNLNVLRNLLTMKFYNELEYFSDSLFAETGADRFFTLMAVNGKSKPDKVSGLYANQTPEYKSPVPLEKKYFETKVDTAYTDMLFHIENRDYILYKVEDMENCKLKEFYVEEGIVYSLVFFLKRYHLNDNDDAITFCSVAVHEDIMWNNAVCNSIISQSRMCTIPILDGIVS